MGSHGFPPLLSQLPFLDVSLVTVSPRDSVDLPSVAEVRCLRQASLKLPVQRNVVELVHAFPHC